MPGDSLDRLEQEFLKEEVDFIRKTIFITLAPQRLRSGWTPCRRRAAEGAAKADPAADLEALRRQSEKYCFSDEIDFFLQKFLL